MAEKPQLNQPWLVAVWPGMGHVALNAGVYLLAKLSMNLIAEFEAKIQRRVTIPVVATDEAVAAVPVGGGAG